LEVKVPSGRIADQPDNDVLSRYQPGNFFGIGFFHL
jgi:hypothetical protein